MSGLQASSLDMSDSRLREIPYRVFERENLNWLVLSNNQIRQIPQTIARLSELTRLALNDNRIDEINPAIGFLKSLSWIDLTRNRLKQLPYEVCNLKNLTGLGLSENEFNEIPECIYRLVGLKKFGFFANRITRISANIKFLINLVKIDLSNNEIEELPDEICELKSLSWLNLSNNRLRTLPMKLNMLVNLEELGLGSNSIENMPSLQGLKKLRILPIFKNKVRHIDGLKSLESLEKLDLSDNEFLDFPSEVLFLRNLKYLNLKNNLMKRINLDEIRSKLHSGITMIDISDNKLQYLPVKFFKIISNLGTLRLHNNPFDLLTNTKPTVVPELLQLCYSKLLNYNSSVSNMWIKDFFKKSLKICDRCNEFFVHEPYLGYNTSSLGDDISFVMQKTLCSLICYKREYN